MRVYALSTLVHLLNDKFHSRWESFVKGWDIEEDLRHFDLTYDEQTHTRSYFILDSNAEADTSPEVPITEDWEDRIIPYLWPELSTKTINDIDRYLTKLAKTELERKRIIQKLSHTIDELLSKRTELDSVPYLTQPIIDQYWEVVEAVQDYIIKQSAQIRPSSTPRHKEQGEKNVITAYSYELKGIKGGYDHPVMQQVYDRLRGAEPPFIEPGTKMSFSIFIAVFKEQKGRLTDNILWTGGIAELAWFIKLLYKERLLEHQPENDRVDWTIAPLCFTIVDEPKYDFRKLRSHHPPARAAIIADIVETIGKALSIQ